MTIWVNVASIAATVIIVALAVLLVRMLSYRRPAMADAPPEFSVSRYQPMAQLMSSEDLDFLSGQPGVTRAQCQAFKRNRRRIFRMYLRELAADFATLHRQAREIVAEAPAGSGVLVGSLLQMQIDFWRFLALIEFQLALDWIGLGHVDSHRLLETINALHTAVARSGSPGPVMV